MRKQRTWREQAQFVIRGVQTDNPNASGDELKKLLFAAYPFGLREHYPYQVWREEVNKTIRGPAPVVSVRDFWVTG